MPNHYPRLLLDETICRRNLSRMALKCREQGVLFRPHFKTHQSAAIGQWFREEGIGRITVSSVRMASYFATHGWDDIFIAFPVNLLEAGEINRLAGSIDLAISIESEESARFMDSRLESPVRVWVKIDTGYHRTGLDPDDGDGIDRVLQRVEGSNRMSFEGFYTHAGHTYHAKSRQEILDIAGTALGLLAGARERVAHRHPAARLSYGDTPSCTLLGDLGEADEVRPGNFIFYDLMQQQLGVCAHENIAVALECPVVARSEARKELLVHGGAVHLSKEFLTVDGTPCYGLVVPIGEDGWGAPLENARVVSLSQEHGIIRTDGDTFGRIRIGDTVGILPVHSCLTANLAERYVTTGGRVLGKMRS